MITKSFEQTTFAEYGEGTATLSSFGQLYSDRTHFVYELLQNAEDKEIGR